MLKAIQSYTMDKNIINAAFILKYIPKSWKATDVSMISKILGGHGRLPNWPPNKITSSICQCSFKTF